MIRLSRCDVFFYFKCCIGQPHLPCFRPCAFDAFFRDIKLGELASSKGLGDKVDGVTLTTPSTSSTLVPFFSWPASPSTSGIYLVDKPCTKNSRCFFCLQLLELRVFRIRYGSAFAGAFHHLALPFTFPIYWVNMARLSIPAAGVRQTPCSCGRWYWRVAGSYSTMPTVTIAPSHFLT